VANSGRTKHSRRRAAMRGEGDIYGVIDDLLAQAFAVWIAVQHEVLCNNEVNLTENQEAANSSRVGTLGAPTNKNPHHPER
jgi:hypothetical protein